ncbi:hypothetical protein [Haladaptatus sp. NG-WS-4]
MEYGETKRTPRRELLRELASLLSSEEWIETISVFPSNRPDSVVVSLVQQHYPREYVSDVYLEVQSYTNGDFHITYLEDHHGEQWMCRWDRHASGDYSRDHFHTPPDAKHEDGVDRTYPPNLTAVISQEVVPWIYQRMGDVWTEYG